MSFNTQSRHETEDYSDQILSKAVKAGRRTYFFDVRATRADDYFLTITESRRLTSSDGEVSYDRHKLFLYKEDFSKFVDGLNEVLDFIRRTKGIPDPAECLPRAVPEETSGGGTADSDGAGITKL